MTQFFKTLARDEEGVTMTEYGLMLFLVAVTCIGAVTLLGNNLNALFNQIAGAV